MGGERTAGEKPRSEEVSFAAGYLVGASWKEEREGRKHIAEMLKRVSEWMMDMVTPKE